MAPDSGEITFSDDADDESDTLLVVTTVERPYVMIRAVAMLTQKGR